MVPFEPFLQQEWASSFYMVVMATLLWFAGLVFIFFFARKLKTQFLQIRESERQRNIAESTLHYLAHFDKNTNLPNRARFDDRLAQSLVQARRTNRKVAVAVVRIDNFTKVCDTFKQPVEDLLIRKFAEVVGSSIRPDDTIARFGKDSLLLLLPGISAKENIARVVDKINSRLENQLGIAGQEIFINASFGVALCPDDAVDADTLVRYAETAADRACSLDRTNLQMYSAELNDMAHEHLFLETALRKAIQDDQFSIHYQPQIDAPSGKITGAEALIRWTHPEKGMITPDRFIPLAENNGMIFPIGEWVMRNACQQAVAWQKEYDTPFQIGVNVSAKQFADPFLIDMVDRVLAETGLPPESLEVEITEGMIMVDVDRAIETLIDLKVRGVKIAIDDFGTGYSSLSQLKKFPIDRLKIDRSFVSELDLDNDDKVIVEMIIELTGKLNISVIAEGVEKSEQKEFLVSRGCYQMQGFFFSRPVPPEDFSMTLEACA
jgi:diguanylate cyclase (GGDEF)-like protein